MIKSYTFFRDEVGVYRRIMKMARFIGLLTTLVGCSAFLSGCPAAGVLPLSSYKAGIAAVAPSIASLPDGTYRARATIAVPLGSFAILNWAEAEVKIANHAYVEAKMTAPTKYPDMMASPQDFVDLGSRIVAAQGTEVDGVSGATFTSAAFLMAVAKAVTR